ncbi:hypothetical protein O181_044695 [Austropuccinia psidii MF-1]|uniref:Uncharacterized protein n=1 Tax=Austropuccinia psidii MF-1 TaxID=1389203 RepID=A0A9Q3DPY6_9BASI|nr:hypothetical protein [Austropuccinia psidii MF-1]
MASGNPQRPPEAQNALFPSTQGEDFPIPPCTPYSRIQEWYIYGIIYHYAPFLLRNPMVMFSGPISMIPNQLPKSITNFEGGLFSSSVWQSMAAIRRSFHDPNHLALQELGWQFFQDHYKDHSQRLFIIQSVFKAASTSILLGQLN